ncbi:IS6 family transposase [Thermococcus stetteri]|uniref:IS6 family transposase n=1 Tax=Thermococcus stetteri TaxID=49900 RepID=UPI001AE4D55E|nr:IS6 family transposase [Thermococcus stetteri]MBP1912036.1 transposase-like protein [Thermococcus stetteri]
MQAETIIYWVVSALKPFRRNKIPAEKKIRAVELYLKGLSYRQVSRILEISHVTVWETVQKLAEAIYKPKILAVKKQRNFIAVDETVIKINGQKRFLWAAIDVESKEILTVWITTLRNWWVARDFILVVLKSCEGQPVFLVDGGSWYKSAFKSLGLAYVHVTFGPRNCVERWFRTVKERTKRFWNNFRSSDWRGVQRFIFLFAFWYNFVRIHSRFNAPPGNIAEWVQEVIPKLS